MKIAVISDTHIPANCKRIPEALTNKLKGVDLIIHAGDLTELSVLDELKKIAPVQAVMGNMDSPRLRKILPDKTILTPLNFKIGVMHGIGHPDNLIHYIKGQFKAEVLDCIIYGHSHKAKIETIDGIIYLNPGSPTDEVFAPFKSFGVLEIGDKIHPEIIKL